METHGLTNADAMRWYEEHGRGWLHSFSVGTGHPVPLDAGVIETLAKNKYAPFEPSLVHFEKAYTQGSPHLVLNRGEVVDHIQRIQDPFFIL